MAGVLPVLLALPVAFPSGSPADETTAELLEEVLAAPNEAPGALFEEIGAHGDQEALNALKECLREVTRPSVAALVAHALRHFDGDDYRRTDALLTLQDLAWDRSGLLVTNDPRKKEERLRLLAEEGSQRLPRAAARSLVHYGDAAAVFLEEIVAEHRDPVMAQIAVGGLAGKLAGEGTEEALETLVAHYRPDVSGTFEAGAEALAGFGAEIAAKRLTKLVGDKRVDDDVRAMALVALTRNAAEEDEGFDRLLRKQLGSDAPRVQRAAVAGLDARSATGHDRELGKIHRRGGTKSRALRHAAYLARGHLMEREGRLDDLRELAFAGAESGEFELRMGAATLLGGLREVGARDALLALLEDASPEVRGAAVVSLVRQRFAEGIPALIERLEVDSQRIRLLVHGALQDLTGLDHGLVGSRWHRWWEAEGERFAVPSTEEARRARRERESRRAESPTQAEFFGIAIRNDRVVFALDCSGSMDEPLSGGRRTRFDAVRSEWMRAIAGLPDTARSNLVLFADGVRAWKRDLAPLDDRARGRLLRFMGERPDPTGGTNLWAGLQLALQIPGVETVILLTDGQPTVGKYTSTRSILAAMRRELEMRSVVIHTVSVIGYSDLLEKIARETGGEYRELHRRL